ncbi:hypothetical protein BCR33DRAFT_736379 [Rhizoclosmatium globosum]|uniref:Uncharacterized protein n=1 Tax=Rhizoclosmatium globosum TaxID=329046 RepID=A0A1Y2CKK5_9FUNG|nr:hypothetical protein BCR33DRAFT_736379 [Rhizoclosmatium globosum]|eukprot:ORY46865.1 hypothetical protein BCR33DRAFT_736379 [Rhizoclosmatium globosum]
MNPQDSPWAADNNNDTSITAARLSADKVLSSTEMLLTEDLDPWTEKPKTRYPPIVFETEVVPLVFAGDLEFADAWGDGGSSNDAGRTHVSLEGEADPSLSGPGPLLGASEPKVFWKSIRGKFVPPSAIPIGRDSDGAPLFATRTKYMNGVHVGKGRNGGGCHIPYGGKEILLGDDEEYDVLCGNPSSIEWVPANNKVPVPLMSTGRLIEGGFEKDGPIFIGICETYFHGTQPGKCGPHLAGLHYSYGGKEINVAQYKVALHAAPSTENDEAEELVTNSGTVYWRAASVKLGVPAGAIRMGRDSDGSPLYAGRVKVNKGGVQVGKVRLDSGCFIGYGGKEVRYKTDFEVLCGDSRIISLVELEGSISLGKLAELKPIEAGNEETGMPLYIGIHEAFGSIQIGKCSPSLKGCHFSYNGKEHIGTKYRLIVYN